MASIIDGKMIAQDIRKEVAEEVAELKKKGIHPHLSVILVGENPASTVYVKNKGKACEEVGMESETLRYPDTISQQELLKIIDGLNRNTSVHGILVQLPLPDHINENTIIESIDYRKDVDGFHPINTGKLASGLTDGFVPCTPAGVVELLKRSGNYPESKHAVIVGRSNIVGKPLGLLLLRKGKEGNATVTYCHSKSAHLDEITRTADILIAAIGKAEMIRGNWIRKGAVVIDVGVNRVEDASAPKGYKLVGDVCFNEAKELASAITPVPGGVGPMTIAFLLKNTLLACKMKEL